MKKALLMLTVGILVLGTMAMSFADAPFGPAAIYASLTNKTQQEAYDLKVLQLGKHSQDGRQGQSFGNGLGRGMGRGIGRGIGRGMGCGTGK